MIHSLKIASQKEKAQVKEAESEANVEKNIECLSRRSYWISTLISDHW